MLTNTNRKKYRMLACAVQYLFISLRMVTAVAHKPQPSRLLTIKRTLMKQNNSKRKALIPSGIWCITSVVVLFGYLGMVMGVPNMLNTIMRTAHDLLLNTVFYLMSICVITGAIGRVFVEFGVVTLLERTLRPLMRPIFNLPGVTSLGAVMTFLSDNPAIISLAHDKRFASYFKKYQFISLTNFGTAFGMGLLVIVFMASQGYYAAPLIGLLGACFGCVCSTRLMQRFVLKAYPQYATEDAVSKEDIEEEEKEEGSQEERLSVCKQCDYLNAGMCKACGCYVEMRAAMKARICPYGKW